jgi:cell shape-determining protein MreD
MGIGLVEDSLTHSILGPNILSKGMVGLLSPLMSGRFFIWTPLFGIAALFGMTFLDGLVSYGARGLFLSPPMEFTEAVTNIFFQSLINAPIGFFIRPRDE